MHLVHPSLVALVPPELLQPEADPLNSSDDISLEKKLIVVSVNQQVPWPEQQQQQEVREGEGCSNSATHPGTSTGQEVLAEKECPVCEQGCTAAPAVPIVNTTTVPDRELCLDELDVLNVNSPFSCLGASNASFDLCLQEEPLSAAPGPSADGKEPLSAEPPSEDAFMRCATWVADHDAFSNRLPFEGFEERESRSPPPEHRASSGLDSSELADDLVVRVPINFYDDLKEAETSLVVRIPWKKFECM